eukprot:5454227-Pyramimonas_sp.AAC.1
MNCRISLGEEIHRHWFNTNSFATLLESQTEFRALDASAERASDSESIMCAYELCSYAKAR